MNSITVYLVCNLLVVIYQVLFLSKKAKRERSKYIQTGGLLPEVMYGYLCISVCSNCIFILNIPAGLTHKPHAGNYW
jgi:hypothetical protein